MPETYRSSHTGSIADLIRRRGDIDAGVAVATGDALSRQAQASGQAWGRAIQGIGNLVSGTLKDYADYQSDAPNRDLRAKQAERLTKELAAMDAATAQSKIGELAGLALSSPDNLDLQDTIAETMARLSPEYAKPLMVARSNPQAWSGVLKTLQTQAPGYKAPEGFSLSEGQTRFNEAGKPLASVPKAAPVAQPYTLTPGSERRGANNEVLASVPSAPQRVTPPQVGSFEDYVIQKFGERPTPQQIETARRVYTDLGREAPAAPPPDGTLSDKQFRQAMQMSNALKAHPAYNDMSGIANGYKGVTVGLNQQNGFGDITAINAFQRMIDPGVSVREGDVALLQSASGVLDKILGDYPIEKLKSGAKLPDAVRERMRKTAKEVYAQRAKSYNESVGAQYRKLSDAAKIPFDFIGTDFSDPEALLEKMGGGSAQKPTYLQIDPNQVEKVAPRRPGGR